MVTSEIFPIREDAKSREGAELLMTRGAVVNKKKVASSSSTVDKDKEWVNRLNCILGQR